ncbi:hypothetical protein ACS0TY_015226 [Phlomoides rotata]
MEPPPVAREMVAGELEAAEALAGLACSASLRRCASLSGEWNWAEAAAVVSATQSQDQPAAADKLSNYAAMIPEKTADNIPSQMCSTSYQSNPVIKTRRKLTQAEKEERKVRRILANRESARQTIRRRQAVHVELTKKAADVLEVNEGLKKEKELALKGYNSLKRTNEFFKAQLDEVKKGAAAQIEAEKPGPSTTNTGCSPVFLHNQPSMIPCFWPSILPSSFQYTSLSHNTSLSQFTMQHGDGQEHSMGSAAPLLVYPVPWLLPLLPHGTNDRPNTSSRCSCSDSRPHEDTNNQMASPHNIPQQDTGHPPGHLVVPGLFSPVRPLETSRPPWGCQVDDTCDVNVVSTPEERAHGSSQRNQEPMKPEDVFATAMARRRRKELMKLKNVRSTYTLNL